MGFRDGFHRVVYPYLRNRVVPGFRYEIGILRRGVDCTEESCIFKVALPGQRAVEIGIGFGVGGLFKQFQPVIAVYVDAHGIDACGACILGRFIAVLLQMAL